MKYYLWWPIAVILWYALYAYISKQNNTADSIKWFILTLAMGFCPFWAIISRSSKRLLFDALLYDTLLFIGQYFMFILLGCAIHYKFINWVGFGFILSGFILIRL